MRLLILLSMLTLALSCASNNYSKEREFEFVSFVDEESLMIGAQNILIDEGFQITEQNEDEDELVATKKATINQEDITFIIEIEYEDDKSVEIETQAEIIGADGSKRKEYYTNKVYPEDYKSYFYNALMRINEISKGNAYPNGM